MQGPAIHAGNVKIANGTVTGGATGVNIFPSGGQHHLSHLTSQDYSISGFLAPGDQGDIRTAASLHQPFHITRPPLAKRAAKGRPSGEVKKSSGLTETKVLRIGAQSM